MVEDETVVDAAADAAHEAVFARLSTADIEDLDITVSFEDGELDVTVYILAPQADADVDQVAEDAALAARAAVDELVEEPSAG
jgi:hypothetical protein